MIIQANAMHIPLADNSVQCVVTSPPYWGLCDYGQVGQIGLETVVQVAPYLSDGYYNDPELTAAKFRNGWYHTGDLGYWLPNGELMHCGRLECSPNCGDINPHIPEHAPDCPTQSLNLLSALHGGEVK